MEILQQIFVMVVTLGLLVAFHEFGHFWVARRCGIKVLKFSVGFGPSLFTWRDKQQTEYTLAAIPLGGYVKMLDEREGEVSDSEKHLAFNNQPVWQRMLVVAAGPVANFILAIFVYWLVFLQGTTQLVPVIYQVEPDSIAAKAGVVQGVEIVSVDGEKTPSAQSVALRLVSRIGTTGDIQLHLKNTKTLEGYDASLPVEKWLSDVGEGIDPPVALGLHFYEPVVEPVIAEVLKGSPADRASLQAGDAILRVDGIETPQWKHWVDYIKARPNIPLKVDVLRGSQRLTLNLTPDEKRVNNKRVGYVGVKAKMPKFPEHLFRHQSYNALTAIKPALKRTWQNIVFSLTSLKKLITGQLSYKQLSGPISIAQVANDSFNISLFAYLSLLALLSVSLGVLNLLPVPVLDGGHLFFYAVEWIKGSPVPEKLQMVAYQVGMFVVLGIMCLALFNDFNRLT